MISLEIFETTRLPPLLTGNPLIVLLQHNFVMRKLLPLTKHDQATTDTGHHQDQTKKTNFFTAVITQMTSCAEHLILAVSDRFAVSSCYFRLLQLFL